MTGIRECGEAGLYRLARPAAGSMRARDSQLETGTDENIVLPMQAMLRLAYSIKQQEPRQ